MEKSIDRGHAQFKQAKREYIEPNMEKAINRALEEFKEAARRCNEPTSEKSMAQLQHENVEYEAKRLAYNALIEAIQYAEAEAADLVGELTDEKPQHRAATLRWRGTEWPRYGSGDLPWRGKGEPGPVGWAEWSHSPRARAQAESEQAERQA